MNKIVNRSIIADAIRAYAIIAMVAYHSSGAYIQFAYKAESRSWWLITDFIRTSTSNCVPLFVMLSGMMLLGKNEPLSLFFRKRLGKVLLPFIAWIVLHLLYLIYIEGNTYSGLEIIKTVLKGPVYPHLWFIYMLIVLYLATPILRIFCNNSGKQTLLYFIILWAIGIGLVPIINKIYECEIYVPKIVAISFVGYYVAGYYFKNLIISSKQIMLASCGVIALIIFSALAVDNLSVNGPKSQLFFFIGFTRINIIFFSFLSFLILKSIDYSKRRMLFFKKTILFFSKTSFGVYLVHYVIIINLRNGNMGFIVNKLGGDFLHPIPGIFLTFIVTMFASLVVVSALRCMPYIKRIVP